MSRTTDIAAEEAARAEAEAPDEEEEAATEEEAVTEPDESVAPDDEPDAGDKVEGHPPQVSEKDIERMHKTLDKEAERHAKRVGAILGDQKGTIQPCPLCIPNIPGFIPSLELGPLPDEVIAKVQAVLAFQVAPPLRDDPYSEQCPDCGGHGKFKTYSYVPNQDTRVCARCSGQGWVAKVENGSQGTGVPRIDVYTPLPVAAAPPPQPQGFPFNT